MAFDIGDIIRRLTGGQDPNAAVMDAQGAMPQQQAPQGLPPVPDTSAPQGARTPVTNPQPQNQTPNTTQSPPDLANMYIKLMEKNQDAQRLDRGMSLIAAGLSNSPTNRAALISSAGHGGSGGMSLSAQDMINFQKQEQANKDMLIRKQALPSLMKQYGMTPAQIQYLEAGGKLDEVIKHFSTENLGVSEDAGTGQKILFNPRTGKEITRLGSEKEDPTQVAAGPQGPQVINMRTGLPVAGGLGLPPDKVEVTMPDGSKQIVDKNAIPSGAQVAPPRKVGDEIPAVTEELHQINKDRAIRGEDPLTAEQLIKLKQTPPNQINVGTDGSVHGKAPEGYEWERDPKTGKILLDEKGHAKFYKPLEGKPSDEKVAKEEKAAKAGVQSAFTASNVGQQVEEALKHVDKPGVVGVGSRALRAIGGPGGLPHDIYDAAIKTISSNVTIETLAQMRAASPTGGALGNVSDFEDKMLQSVIAPLATYTSPELARKGLIRVRAAMELLADDNFNKDKGKFIEALNRRVEELSIASPVKGGVKVERVK